MSRQVCAHATACDVATKRNTKMCHMTNTTPRAANVALWLMHAWN